MNCFSLRHAPLVIYWLFMTTAAVILWPLASTTCFPRSPDGHALPQSCYSPSGDDCSWYTECLERKKACGPKTGYALVFGKKYCELFNDNYYWFTELTRRWVDATRKCLQVSLVPLLRDSNDPSCETIKKTAISQHTGCYLSPGTGQPSFCDVIENSCVDLLKIFYTIKAAFVDSDLTVLVGAWKSFFEVGWACRADFLQHCILKSSVRVVSLTVLKPKKKCFGWSHNLVESEPETEAVELAEALSTGLNWKAKGIEWIPLSVEGGTDTITLRLLLCDQREFNLSDGYSQPLDLGKEVRDLQDQVGRGDLRLKMKDGRKFYARQTSDCANSNCTVVRSSVSAPAAARGTGLLQTLQRVVTNFAELLLGNCIDAKVQ